MVVTHLTGRVADAIGLVIMLHRLFIRRIGRILFEIIMVALHVLPEIEPTGSAIYGGGR